MNALMSNRHRKTLVSIVTALLFAPGAVAGADWGTDLKAAQAEAKAAGKHVLVDFTGSDWCGFCIKLNEEVLSTEEFKAWAADNVILVELDFPRKKVQPAGIKARNKALKEQFEVPGFPTVLLMTGDGEVVHKEVGYAPGSGGEWLGKMKAAASGSD